MAEHRALDEEEERLLSAWIDDELEPGERGRVERLLAASVAAREFLEALREDRERLRTTLAMAPLPEPELRESRRRILEAIGSVHPPELSRVRGWLTWLVGRAGRLLPAGRAWRMAGGLAAVLLVGMLFPSGPRRDQPPEVPRAMEPARPGVPAAAPGEMKEIVFTELETGAGGSFLDLQVSEGSLTTRFEVPGSGIEVLWVVDSNERRRRSDA